MKYDYNIKNISSSGILGCACSIPNTWIFWQGTRLIHTPTLEKTLVCLGYHYVIRYVYSAFYMRADQTLDFVKMCFVNTCFAEPKDLERNLSICFGDGDIRIDNINEEQRKILVNIQSKPYIANQYNRHFAVTYGFNNGGERSEILPLKIVAIEEMEVAVWLY